MEEELPQVGGDLPDGSSIPAAIRLGRPQPKKLPLWVPKPLWLFSDWLAGPGTSPVRFKGLSCSLKSLNGMCSLQRMRSFGYFVQPHPLGLVPSFPALSPQAAGRLWYCFLSSQVFLLSDFLCNRLRAALGNALPLSQDSRRLPQMGAVWTRLAGRGGQWKLSSQASG